VNRELDHFAANLLAYRVTVGDFPDLTVIGVYAPAWPVERNRLEGEDVQTVKLAQNPDVWVADLLVAALRQRSVDDAAWIVAGDFNSCESFDSWKSGPRGNREWLDRMAALGLTECLRHSQGALTPTFRRPGVAEPKSQIDHLFASGDLARRLVTCQTGDANRVYGQQLSDHLPIVADFRRSLAGAAATP
jgi:exonuclease III